MKGNTTLAGLKRHSCVSPGTGDNSGQNTSQVFTGQQMNEETELQVLRAEDALMKKLLKEMEDTKALLYEKINFLHEKHSQHGIGKREIIPKQPTNLYADKLKQVKPIAAPEQTAPIDFIII